MILGPISVLGAIVLGAALLWSARLVYGERQSNPNDAVRLVMTIAGWTLIQIGILSVAAQVIFVVPEPSLGLAHWIISMGIGGILLIPVILAALGIAVARYRTLEWTSLMWLLSAASERGIPLPRAVRSFASERSDELGIRAARLADLLEEGVALPEALDHSRTHLPLEGVLAARYGAETGDLGPAIAGLARGVDEVETLVRTAVDKCFYLSLVIWVMMVLLVFMNLTIIPVFSKIFTEFDIQLPAMTSALLKIGDIFVDIGPLLPLICFPLGVLLLMGLLHNLGWLPRDLPLIGRVTRRYDGALVMRVLAVGVHQNRPLNRIVWMLARLYPKRGVRASLQRAGERINNGEDWCDSLVRQRLIRRGDAAVFKAAQRVGNLEWALDEMADGALRRITYRLLLVLNIFFPLVILLIGAVVAFIAVGLFHPLVRLISTV
jgi:type II secretory pathway component PulF